MVSGRDWLESNEVKLSIYTCSSLGISKNYSACKMFELWTSGRCDMKSVYYGLKALFPLVKMVSSSPVSDVHAE